MKISTRWIKRVFVLSLVVLLSIKSFGAILYGDDGPAFVTNIAKTKKNELVGISLKLEIKNTSRKAHIILKYYSVFRHSIR